MSPALRCLLVLLSLATGVAVAQPVPDDVLRSSDAVVSALREGDYDAIADRFDPAALHGMTTGKLADLLRQAMTPMGPLAACEPPTSTARAGGASVEVRCAFATSRQTVRLGWNAAGRLTGLFLVPLVETAVADPREIAITTGAPGWPLPGLLLRPDAEVPDFTLDDESVDDAVAALALVAAQRDLGPVFVIGHSQGAWLAPRIAARAKAAGVPIAGIVMLAGNVTPLADLVVRQYEAAVARPTPNATAATVADMRIRRDHVYALVARGHGVGETLPFDAPASWWLDAARYDPARTLLDQPGLPALLTFGERDYQVPIAERAGWSKRLGGRRDTTLVAFPRVNHLLIEGDGPRSPAEYDVPGHVSQPLIDRVARWIDDEVAATLPAR